VVSCKDSFIVVVRVELGTVCVGKYKQGSFVGTREGLLIAIAYCCIAVCIHSSCASERERILRDSFFDTRNSKPTSSDVLVKADDDDDDEMVRSEVDSSSGF